MSWWAMLRNIRLQDADGSHLRLPAKQQTYERYTIPRFAGRVSGHTSNYPQHCESSKESSSAVSQECVTAQPNGRKTLSGRALSSCVGWLQRWGANDLDKFVALIGSFACAPLMYICPYCIIRLLQNRGW